MYRACTLTKLQKPSARLNTHSPRPPPLCGASYRRRLELLLPRDPAPLLRSRRSSSDELASEEDDAEDERLALDRLLDPPRAALPIDRSSSLRRRALDLNLDADVLFDVDGRLAVLSAARRAWLSDRTARSASSRRRRISCAATLLVRSSLARLRLLPRSSSPSST